MKYNIFSRAGSLLLISLCSLFWSTPALAAAEIVVMKGRDIGPYNKAVSGLVEGLGFTPVIYELDGDPKAARRLARKLAVNKPDMVVSVGTMASVAASDEIKDVPLVYLMVSRPDVYLKSGANITGISLNPAPEDQFDLLQRFYPSATKIGVIFNPENSLKEVKEIRRAALPGYEIVEVTIKKASDLSSALKKVREKSDILWLVMDNDIMSRQAFQYIVKFSVAKRYPLLGFSRSTVKAGALISAISDYREIGREGAKMVKEVLSGDRTAFSTPHHYPGATGYAYNKRIGKLTNRSLAFKMEE